MSKISNIINKNQNNHRLTTVSFKDINTIPEVAKRDILTLLASKGDRAHHTLAILLWAIISNDKPVFILSQRDLDILIKDASIQLSINPFSVISVRTNKLLSGGTMSIYGQLTGLLIREGFIKLLQPSKKGSKIPAILEVIDAEWLSYLTTQPNDELRSLVVNSTIRQEDNTNKTTILQDYNTTSVSELQSELVNELQEVTFIPNKVISDPEPITNKQHHPEINRNDEQPPSSESPPSYEGKLKLYRDYLFDIGIENLDKREFTKLEIDAWFKFILKRA